jgi:hypothetical protein
MHDKSVLGVETRADKMRDKLDDWTFIIQSVIDDPHCSHTVKEALQELNLMHSVD